MKTKAKTYTLYLRSIGLVEVRADYIDLFIDLDSELRRAIKSPKRPQNLGNYKKLAAKVGRDTKSGKSTGFLSIILMRLEARLYLQISKLLEEGDPIVRLLPDDAFYALQS